MKPSRRLHSENVTYLNPSSARPNFRHSLNNAFAWPPDWCTLSSPRRPYFRAQRPKITWKKIAGMRDVLIHDYVSVDITLVWDTVQRDGRFKLEGVCESVDFTDARRLLKSD